MTATPKSRRMTVARSRAKHHQKQIAKKRRVDAYIEASTKKILKQIKEQFSLSNEGEAIDKAAQIAAASLENETSSSDTNC